MVLSEEGNGFVFLMLLSVICVLFLSVVIIVLSDDVVYDTEISCNTGDLDLYYSNSSEEFNITGIDGLTCSAKISGSMPVYMVKTLMMVGR